MAFPNLRVCCDLVKDDPIGKVNVASKAVSKRKQRQLFLVCFQVVLNNQRTKPSCSHQHLSSTILLVEMCRIYQPFQLMSRFRWKSVKALTACPLSWNCPINFDEDQLASSPTILYPAVLLVIGAIPYCRSTVPWWSLVGWFFLSRSDDINQSHSLNFLLTQVASQQEIGFSQWIHFRVNDFTSIFIFVINLANLKSIHVIYT